MELEPWLAELNVLAGADERDLTKLDEYRAIGGYDALEKARAMAPQAVIEEISSASNLRGRGGAGFPMGRKASLVLGRTAHRSRTTSSSTRTSPSRARSRTARSCCASRTA